MNYDEQIGERPRIVISWSNPAGAATTPEDKRIDITSLHHNDRWGEITFIRGGGTAGEPADKLATTWADLKSN